jgi:hypothetical protein
VPESTETFQLPIAEQPHMSTTVDEVSEMFESIDIATNETPRPKEDKGADFFLTIVCSVRKVN